MEIVWFDEIDSTQKYLIEKIKSKELSAPIAVAANFQTSGIGSRGNEWKSEKGNLFFSFAYEISSLPDDLPIVSASIYFSYILKEILSVRGSGIWLKWPNDFYIESRKIGGTITTKAAEALICGIGLNTAHAPHGYGKLDIQIEKEDILKNYFSELKKSHSWKQIFSKYKLEFHRSKKFLVHVQEKKISLENARLCEDGSLEINSQRIYCLR
ncbi:biotin--[acetyl-CoA-carboxylase] ligase [Nitrosophilus alvini]|uniref:biotin--[acetyl-CoA-carboxylase] ligase n=1 Tax=Nitrosophilus alvini TaxID=2714855 RepID=UPI00190976DB|nr:biotin--[acetyl-CoA-carboxylase] ligase [Nitrosophilus alvini]